MACHSKKLGYASVTKKLKISVVFHNKDYLLHLYNPFINGGLTEALL